MAYTRCRISIANFGGDHPSYEISLPVIMANSYQNLLPPSFYMTSSLEYFRSSVTKTLDWSVETLGGKWKSFGLCKHLCMHNQCSEQRVLIIMEMFLPKLDSMHFFLFGSIHLKSIKGPGPSLER